jgi:uncharacterized protein (DUF1778 family)
MASKKIPKPPAARPDKYTKKRSGQVAQSLRLTVAENKLLREAATLERMSINVWAVRTLLAAAKRRIAAESKNVPST